MPKRKIIRMRDIYETDKKGYLTYENKSIPEDSEYYKKFIAPNIIDFDPKDMGLEELAEMCDQEAEARNDHEYVGAHRLLAALLYGKLGRDVATSIMKEIAEYGGLDHMVGRDGQKPVYEELGIKCPWHEWSLKE